MPAQTGELDRASDRQSLLWPNWIEWAKSQTSIQFIAQGTLINRQSIGQTLGNASLHGPVIARGVRRVFNFALLDENYVEFGGRYTPSARPERRATLNVVETGRQRDVVNGVLFTVKSDEVEDIAAREFGYDLLEVRYSGQSDGVAHLFIARKGSEYIGHRVLDDILPNESSLNTCLLGAATYGDDFVKTWIRNCITAGGQPLVDHEYCRDIISDVVGFELLESASEGDV